MNYSLAPVPLAEIDLQDTAFQISTDPDVSGLAASIDALGLLVPPILHRVDGRCVIISGFRRIAACHALGWTTVTARCPSASTSASALAGAAVAENALQRPLNLIETSRALALLAPHFNSHAELSAASEGFGIPENPAMIQKLLPLCRLPQEMQAAILDGTLSLAMVQELGRRPLPAGKVLSALFMALKMSLSKQREVLTLIEEVCHREATTVADLLTEPVFADLIKDPSIDGNVKAARLRSLLKQRRYPAVHAAKEKADALIRALKLTGPMTLTPPKDFEGMNFTLTMRFQSLDELKHLHQRLHHLLDRPELAQLLSKDL